MDCVTVAMFNMIVGKWWSFSAQRHAYCTRFLQASWWHHIVCSL